MKMYDSKRVYELGNARLEVKDPTEPVWLQIGIAGFWANSRDFENLLSLMNAFKTNTLESEEGLTNE